MVKGGMKNNYRENHQYVVEILGIGVRLTD